MAESAKGAAKIGKEWFYGILGVVVLVGGYFIYKWITAPTPDSVAAEAAANAALNPTPANKAAAAAAAKTASLSKTVGSGFPLQNGSTGANVKALQNALIAADPNALPNYGADGIFGSEVAAALAAQGYPATIDQATFNTITAAGAAANSLIGYGASANSDSLPVLNVTTGATTYANTGDYVMIVDSISGGEATGHIYDSNGNLQTVQALAKYLTGTTASFAGNNRNMTGNQMITGKPIKLKEPYLTHIEDITGRFDISNYFDGFNETMEDTRIVPPMQPVIMADFDGSPAEIEDYINNQHFKRKRDK